MTASFTRLAALALACLAIAPATATAAPRSDEFDGAALDTSLWTFSDPVGDSTLTVGAGRATITVAPGVTHDLWTGADQAPRLLQPAPNADFEVELKFDSAVTQRFQLQGLVVRGSDGKLLRLEVHSDGSGTRLFAAGIDGGAATVLHHSTVAAGAPAYLRVRRSGQNWTFRHSLDGARWSTPASFTFALAVDALGPFAGNVGTFAPGHAAQIDYFRVIPQDTDPPVVSNVGVAPAAISATVSWTTNEPATSTVQFGEPGQPLSSATRAGLRRDHSVVLQGLRCATTYTYRVQTADEGGREAQTLPATFTTRACPTGITSDQFDGDALDTSVWTFVDPVGDSTLSVSGGHASLTLPAGSSHDLWTGANHAPRLLQAAPDTDFEVEVKFDSPVTQQYQMQGIVVEQDRANLLRLEVHSDGTQTKLFAASIENGQGTPRYLGTIAGGAPTHLRLSRAGDRWTLRYSKQLDEWSATATFNHALRVTAIGPYAGNAGGDAPGLAAQIDYFQVAPPDATPPAITEVAADPASITADVTWRTDEAATSAVAYGEDASYGASGWVEGMVRSHSVRLHGLRCGTVYHYKVTSRDDAGNENASPDATFATDPCPPGLVSDDFDGTTLDRNRWSVVDPVGDSQVSVDSGRARIALTAGVQHDLWTGANHAPRLLQAAPDTDFEIEAKFDSRVTQQYQMQGIVVEQDFDDLLRLEVHHDGSSVRLFAASIEAGAARVRHVSIVEGGASAYLRVRRAGDRWTVRYSTDGLEWSTAAAFTQALTVSAVGPFAANAGQPAPGFATAVDYFRVINGDDSAPSISAVETVPSTIKATVRWTTDEPGTSEVHYGPDAAYGATVRRSALVRDHALELRGLRCGTEYHFQIRSADASENEGRSPDATFMTQACPEAMSSDEFDGTQLDETLWSFEDPVGDATVSVGGGRAAISLPAGVSHDLWSDANLAARLLQPAPDDDFEIQVKFASAVTQQYQMQGLVVEQDPDDLLRLEVHHDGTATKLFVAVMRDGVVSSKHLSTVAGGSPTYLRLKRAGDRWTLRYSSDGANWTGSASFTQDLQVGSVGPFAGNTGANPPAFTALVDSFSVVPPPAPDAAAPVIDAVAHEAAVHSARVSWTTDERSTSQVQYGTTTAYERSPVASQEEVTDHMLKLRALACETTYHYRVVSTDAVGNVATGNDRTFTTGTCPPGGGPAIDVWYGDEQTFGARGTPQTQINVLGSAEDPDGLAWVDYSLNGSVPRTLTIDPDNNPRIAELGDFNVEIDRSELRAGANSLQLIASDRGGRQTTRTVTINHVQGVVATIPLDADWSAATRIADAAQIVDGRWARSGDTVRTVEPAYDRMLALGEVTWTDFEVSAPVTIHSLSSTSQHAGVGIAVGWRGHEGSARPRLDWPLGSMCFYFRNQRSDPYQLWMARFQQPNFVANDGSQDHLALGTTYIWKVRTEAIPARPGTSRYSCKVWPAASAEPAAWNVTVDLPSRAGGVALVADYADVSFGTVSVRSLSESGAG